MDKIKIGRVSGAQGLRGEIKLYHDSGDEEAIKRLSSLFLCAGDGRERLYLIENLRMQKRTPVLKLEGIDDRSAAEILIGQDVYALLDESRPSEDGAFLVSDLIGLKVRLDGEAGALVGEVRAVIDNPAHDILEIEADGVVRLLPLVDVFVKDLCPEKGFIIILPPEGWFG